MNDDLLNIVPSINIDLDLDVTSKEDRIKQTPITNGEWKRPDGSEAQRGNGRFVPTDKERKKILKKYGTKYINYRNGKPDFSPYAAETVKIYNMEGGNEQSRARNFANANREFLKKEKAMELGLKTQTDVEQYMKSKGYTWHELDDGVTMQMVPSEINNSFSHSGGVSTMKNIEESEDGFRLIGHTIGVQKVKLNQKVVKIKHQIRDTIGKSNTFIDDATERFISTQFAEINRSGLNEAAASAMFAATLSITKNTILVCKGEENADEALKQVLIDTSSSAVLGYAAGTVEGTLGLADTSSAYLLVNATVQTSKHMITYINGEIDGKQMAENIAESSVYLVSAYIGKSIGGTIGTFLAGGPGLGTYIGQYIGEMITTAICTEVISTIKLEREFNKQNAKIVSLYKNAEREIRQSQARLTELVQRENNELIVAIQSGFDDIKLGIETNSYETIKKGLSVIGSKFGFNEEDFAKDLITRENLFSNETVIFD